MVRIILVLVAAMLAAGLPARAAPERERDEAQLRHIKTEVWPSFYRKQDAKGLESFLAPAFVNIAPDGGITTRAEELEGVRQYPWNPKNFRYTIGQFVWLSGDLVIIVGRGESDRSSDDGKPCRHGYASSNLLTRAPNAPLGWQALSSHVSGDACVPQ
jgi:hypothetical protein